MSLYAGGVGNSNKLLQMTFIRRLVILFYPFMVLSVAAAPTGLYVDQFAPYPQNYKLNSQRSVIRIYTDTSGLLKLLGHRHIVSINDIQGEVVFHSREQAFAHLRFMPENFVVDDPRERARAPSGYRSRLNESARQATRDNMLGPALLDVESYPMIAADIHLVSLKNRQAGFRIVLKLKKKSFSLLIPGTLMVDGDHLRSHAEFTLDHSEIGLKPFSVAGGTIKVAHQLRFEIDLYADRVH